MQKVINSTSQNVYRYWQYKIDSEIENRIYYMTNCISILICFNWRKQTKDIVDLFLHYIV